MLNEGKTDTHVHVSVCPRVSVVIRTVWLGLLVCIAKVNAKICVLVIFASYILQRLAILW